MSAAQPDSQDDAHEAQEVLAEQALANAGQSVAQFNYSQKLLEQKERELMESIAANYGRIREVERELGNLQLQLKLTAGPKKHALELLRRKIETQNERVVAVRARHAAAKATYEKLDTELKAEEAAKDRLCTELNTLVQQAARAQLDKLEELKSHLEGLYSTVLPKQQMQPPQAGPATSLPPPQQLAAGSATPSAAGPSQQDAAGPSDNPFLGPSSDNPFAASPSEAAQRQQQEQLERERQERERLDQERARQEQERRRREAEAAAARSRHVSLNPAGSSPTTGASSPTRSQASGSTGRVGQGAGLAAGSAAPQAPAAGRTRASRSPAAGPPSSSPDSRFSGFDT